MPEINKNTGILLVPLSPKAFLLGAESGVKFEVRLPNADWFNFTPTDEKQYTASYDTMSCTTFSALNLLEMQVNWLVKNNKIGSDAIALLKEWGFFDENGKFNCSDWFTAVMSGTTSQGNDFGSVWESIRKNGVLPQKDGYKPADFNSNAEWLNRTKVTSEQQEKALKFLEVFEIAYEFILSGTSNPSVIAEHLKHAPIHIATPVCGGWGNESTVQKCGLEQVQHATCSDGTEKDNATFIYDHYDPMHKKLAWDYPIPWAVKGVLSVKVPKPKTDKPVFTFTKTLQRGSKGLEVEMLQKALKYLGFFTLGNTTDYYGYYTEQAVKAFQQAYATDILYPIGLTLPTGKFASMSIKKLNQLLKI